jgi:type IV fimbrial biogenesis protein FimT
MNKMHASGFTLIELMVTVAMIAIVLMIGVPSFRQVMMNNRMATQANDFLGSMNLARSEAVKRGQRVALCKSADPTAATPTCSTTGGWDQGWLIFVDTDDDATLDVGEVLLRVHESIAPSTLSGNTNVDDYLSYAADGVTHLKSGGTWQAGTLMLCPGTSGMTGRGRKIMINMAGRARIAPDTDTTTTTTTCP